MPAQIPERPPARRSRRATVAALLAAALLALAPAACGEDNERDSDRGASTTEDGQQELEERE